MKNLNFYHLTDLHYYANEEIGSSGVKYDLKCKLDQKCMAESGAIIDSAFDSIIDDKENEIVLISGDLTFDGEKQSHDSLVKKLNHLQENGKRVFITFATHDFNMYAKKFTDEIGDIYLEKYTRQELRNLYNEFGYKDAVSVHEGSFSYCAQLSEEVRILALNDDGDGKKFCGYYNDLLKWIKEQVEKAKNDGCEIFAMTHHPVLAPSPIYPMFSKIDMLGGYEYISSYLADVGIRYIFVGHTHIHDIDYTVSEKGNKLYQVNTAALTAYPLAYRKVEFSDKGMDVKTLQVEEIDYYIGDISVIEYAKEHFLYMVKEIFRSLEEDYDNFLLLSQGFSGNREQLLKLKPVLQKFGKFANGLTFSKMCSLFGCSKYVEDSIKDKSFIEFVCEVIINMYSGQENYSPDTAEYKAFIAVCKRLGVFVKLTDDKNNKISLDKLMADIIYDGGIDDWNAVLA